LKPPTNYSYMAGGQNVYNIINWKKKHEWIGKPEKNQCLFTRMESPSMQWHRDVVIQQLSSSST
jgi:hypothetical protein